MAGSRNGTGASHLGVRAMSDEDEGFVARWSRLKRETAQDKAKPGAAVAGTPDADEAGEAGKSHGKEEAEAALPFDPASLPSVESITAGTDIREFLRAGVPAELTKAALRRVWTTDPAIRDFIGLAENQWDFTDPNAMPGFGPLDPTDDVQKLVAQAMGKLDDVTKPDVETVAGVGETSQEMPGPSDDQPRQTAVAEARSESGRPPENAGAEPNDAVAPQHSPSEELPRRRRHGGALPS